VKKKILVIEDEPHHVLLIQARLESEGLTAISALDGEEGLKKVKEEKVDLIVLDIVMPKIDGVEVCRRLKQDPGTKKIPVLILTASGVKDIEEECLNAGADDFLRKPYEAGEFVGKIKVLLKD